MDCKWILLCPLLFSCVPNPTAQSKSLPFVLDCSIASHTEIDSFKNSTDGEHLLLWDVALRCSRRFGGSEYLHD